MARYLVALILLLIFPLASDAQNRFRGTVAMDSFKFQPVSRSTETFYRSNVGDNVGQLSESLVAMMTDKLRKVGFTVVNRKNRQSVLEENRLAQLGVVDDEGTTKLRAADFTIVGTIRQFEENEKSRGTAAVVGALVGSKVRQAQAVVEIVFEMMARDGTVVATATGKATKDGRMTTVSGAGTAIGGKIIGFLDEGSKDFQSNAMSNATSTALETAAKELAVQARDIDFVPDRAPRIDSPSDYNLRKARVVVAFPDSQVAEEVFLEAVDEANGRGVLAQARFRREQVRDSASLASFCDSILREDANAKVFVYGTIDTERFREDGLNVNRISMSVRAVSLRPFRVIYADSIQASVGDVSNSAANDRVVKEAARKQINRAIMRIAQGLDRNTEDRISGRTFTLTLSGFSSFASANRFYNLLKANPDVVGSELIDFKGDTLFAEISVRGGVENVAQIVEDDRQIREFFTVTVSSSNDNKLVGSVVAR